MKTKYKVIIYILAALAAGFVAFVNLNNESNREVVFNSEQQEERFEIVRDTIIVDNIDSLPCIIDSIKL